LRIVPGVDSPVFNEELEAQAEQTFGAER